MANSQRVTIGETEVEIRETDDGFEAVEVDGLPTLGAGWQMKEELFEGKNFNFYLDKDGDVWIEHDGTCTCLTDSDVDRLLEARERYR